MSTELLQKVLHIQRYLVTSKLKQADEFQINLNKIILTKVRLFLIPPKKNTHGTNTTQVPSLNMELQKI